MTRPDPPVSGEKVCPRCERTLHVLAFAVDRSSADGLYYHCRECASRVSRTSYARRRKPRKYFVNPYGDNGPL